MPDLDRYCYRCAACRQPSTTSLCAFCQLRMRYYLALRCFRHRWEATPLSGRKAIGLQNWADWFKARTGESVKAFGRRAKQEKLRERIARFEIAVYGRTNVPGGFSDGDTV